MKTLKNFCKLQYYDKISFLIKEASKPLPSWLYATVKFTPRLYFTKWHISWLSHTKHRSALSKFRIFLESKFMFASNISFRRSDKNHNYDISDLHLDTKASIFLIFRMAGWSQSLMIFWMASIRQSTFIIDRGSWILTSISRSRRRRSSSTVAIMLLLLKKVLKKFKYKFNWHRFVNKSLTCFCRNSPWFHGKTKLKKSHLFFLGRLMILQLKVFLCKRSLFSNGLGLKHTKQLPMLPNTCYFRF